jgi:predicted nucleic acid-binding protein
MTSKTKIKLYLDTSIPSAYFDYSKPVRQLLTQKWFEHEASRYELYISVITIEEVEKIENDIKKHSIKDLLAKHNVIILELSGKALDLADEYMTKGAIPTSEPEDAYHISIAVVNDIDALVSWNFKHIVSINPIRKIHEINKRHRYGVIEIGSPEMFGGAHYGSL